MKRILFALLLVLVGCSNAGLQPLDESQNNIVDNRIEISGEVCTSLPKEQVFPVKIMFIVDCSGSMQFTDPSDSTASPVSCAEYCAAAGTPGAQCAALCQGADNPGRQAAVRKVVDRFRNNPAVSFSIVRFNGRITINGGANTGGNGFTNSPSALNDGLASLSQAEITTDYQGALSTAYQILEKDMIATDPVELARTKYVIIFLSDGAPDPVCTKGCGNDKIDLGDAIPIDNWCDVPRDQWCDTYNPQNCDTMLEWYPAMGEPCQEYNTEEQIIKQVNEIMDLGEQYGAGELRMHTAFLFADGVPQAILDLFLVDKAKSESLLKAMAQAGDGLYRSFNAGQKIDFLDINYATIARPFGMTNLIVSNLNVRPYINKLLIDSDGDGVDDQTEFDAHINMDGAKADSDGDGYNDKLEYNRMNAGFNPGDPDVPVRECPQNERIDRDGDGLLDCEEAILGTNPKIVDTDRDRIPDGIEFLFDTNPLSNDSKIDIDFDGKLSGEEINIHSSPTITDQEIHASYRYIYNVHEQPEQLDLRKCYDFNVRQVRLLTTDQKGSTGTAGYNEIIVYFGEGPADDPRDYGNFKAACIRAQYVEPSYKFPADGKIALTSDNFLTLPELLAAQKAALNDPSLDPCVGAPLP